MRRNGLLLEHIMHERLNRDQASFDYFKTPGNIQELRNEYRPQLFWPKRETPQPSPVPDDTIIPLAELQMLEQQAIMALGLKASQSSV